MDMKSIRIRRNLAALAATITMAGGLLVAAPAAHANERCASDEVEVGFSDSAFFCDPNHQPHRDSFNRCDVWEIASGANWLAAWTGPDMAHLHYSTFTPYSSEHARISYTFCVGDIAVNP